MTCINCLYCDICNKMETDIAKGNKETAVELCIARVSKNKADFVEVVRCKDCKNRYTLGCPMLHYVDGELIGHTEDYAFCSDGERKEVKE